MLFIRRARKEAMHSYSLLYILQLAILCVVSAHPPTKFYEFNITQTPITRLCNTKAIITVNNQFPGPSIDVNEGDLLIVKVNNQLTQNITLHWHGLLQNRTGWYDGPAYVTQCPIQTGSTYVYKIQITGQRGTLWWHAHITFFRATVYGSLVIHPNERFPFLERGEEKPVEHVLMLGEWWKSDILDIINQAKLTGAGTNISDALTINGLPGPLYGACAAKDTHVFNVLPNKKYLLRIINSAMGVELFFGIANHTLTVVEADAQYVKPFTTNTLVISPGQTVTVLLTTDQAPGSYYMATHVFVSTLLAIPFNNGTAAAVLRYPGQPATSNKLPSLPTFGDTAYSASFAAKLRSLKKVRTSRPVPTTPDEELFIAVGLNIQSCPKGANPNVSCLLPVSVPGGARFSASMNNISYVEPTKAFLKQHYDQMHFGKKPKGYTMDFPTTLAPFNFTATQQPATFNQNPQFGTKAHYIEYGSNVQIVLQGTTLIALENHPIHLHGFDFYVVATGVGNYNASRDVHTFNLVDPPLRNTISLPAAGWAVIRFKADNPGTWIIHCHLDLHSLSGLVAVLIVKDGKGPLQCVEPPPPDLPPC